NDVLIKFCQAGIAQSIREFTTNGPNLLASPGAESGFDAERFLERQYAAQFAHVASYSTRLSVQFDNQISLASPQALAFGSLVGCCQREGIRDLQGGGQKSRGKNGANRPRRTAHGAEPNRVASAVRRQRKQFQRSLCDHSE